MSHITKIKVEVKDLIALERAAAELGCIFLYDQKTYRWFGHWVGDSPMPEGLTKEELGKCSHAIKVPGIDYEIGVVERKDAPGTYMLVYDSWDAKKGEHTNLISRRFGKSLEAFGHEYAVQKIVMESEDRGLIVDRIPLVNGSEKLVIGGTL